MKNKKGIKILAITMTLVILLILGGYIVIHLFFSGYARIYESNWSIDIPNDFKEIYSIQNEHDFQGKGLRYTIFSVKNSKDFFNDGFSSEKNEKFENDIIQLLEELKADDAKRPDFTKTYSWKLLQEYHNNLYIIYYADEQQVYFIEDLF